MLHRHLHKSFRFLHSSTFPLPISYFRTIMNFLSRKRKGETFFNFRGQKNSKKVRERERKKKERKRQTKKCKKYTITKQKKNEIGVENIFEESSRKKILHDLCTHWYLFKKQSTLPDIVTQEHLTITAQHFFCSISNRFTRSIESNG